VRLHRAGVAVCLVAIVTVTVGVARSSKSPGATVHEWGTFTSVAGIDGNAIDWLPLGGPTDLPCFVKHVRMATPAPAANTRPAATVSDTIRRIIPGGVRTLNTSAVTKGEVIVGLRPAGTTAPIGQPLLTFEEARQSLWGKVRMETPVIYFYSADPYDVRVTVSFRQGVITEFYPTPENETAPFSTMTLRNPQHAHTMNWNVSVVPKQPELYPHGGEASHYYAARATDATPLRVGAESEKFIFYRGVANFEVPIRAFMTNDSVLVVSEMGQPRVPAVILFENRNGRMGFRSLGALETHITVAKPALTANVASIRAELQKVLEKAGLYPKEATAMLDTWRDSWFEEGLRVFYLTPETTVNTILPLQITPAPTDVKRVFVGRVELIDRTTMNTVHAALEENNAALLSRYARFLHPITDRIIARGADYATANRISAVANSAYAKYNKDSRACQ
jgi:hypothetical protein